MKFNCNNMKCQCNKKKEIKKSFICKIGWHDFHLPKTSTYYKCVKCGMVNLLDYL